MPPHGHNLSRFARVTLNSESVVHYVVRPGTPLQSAWSLSTTTLDCQSKSIDWLGTGEALIPLHQAAMVDLEPYLNPILRTRNDVASCQPHLKGWQCSCLPQAGIMAPWMTDSPTISSASATWLSGGASCTRLIMLETLSASNMCVSVPTHEV